MDQRIEAFLADVLALAGEDLDAVREGVRVALASCEEVFRAQEANKRMKDKAAYACRALCRARVADESQRRRGTRIAEHLKLVQSIIDGRSVELARAPLPAGPGPLRKPRPCFIVRDDGGTGHYGVLRALSWGRP
jgi:hypothetical protein